MGIAAGLGSAITWAIASTFLGSQTAKIDTFTLVFVRSLFSAPLLIAVLFIVGAEDELWNLPWNNAWQLAWAGFFATGSGDLLFAAAFFLIGMSRALTIVMSLNVLFSFALASIFLGDDPTLQIGIGAVLILVGVYTVALYGQPHGAGSTATGLQDATVAPRPIAGGALPPPSEENAAQSWLQRHRLSTGVVVAALVAGLFLRRRTAARPAKPTSPAATPPLPSPPLPPLYPRSSPPARTSSAATAAPALPASRPVRPAGRRAAALAWVLKNRLPIGVVIAALAGLNWAIAIVWLRGASFDVDPVAGVTVRMPLVLGIFGILAIAYPKSSIRKRNISRRGFAAMAISGVIGTGIASLLILVSIQEIGAGEATTLLSTGPLWGLPLAVVFLRERITRWAVVGAVVAVTGIVLIA